MVEGLKARAPRQRRTDPSVEPDERGAAVISVPAHVPVVEARRDRPPPVRERPPRVREGLPPHRERPAIPPRRREDPVHLAKRLRQLEGDPSLGGILSFARELDPVSAPRRPRFGFIVTAANRTLLVLTRSGFRIVTQGSGFVDRPWERNIRRPFGPLLAEAGITEESVELGLESLKRELSEMQAQSIRSLRNARAHLWEDGLVGSPRRILIELWPQPLMWGRTILNPNYIH